MTPTLPSPGTAHDEWESPTLASVGPQSGITGQKLCLASRGSTHRLSSPRYTLEFLSPPPAEGCQAPGGHQCHFRHILPPLRQLSALHPPGKPQVEAAYPCPGMRQEPMSQSHAPQPPWSCWCGGHWDKILQGEQKQAPGHQPAFLGCLQSSTLPGSKAGLRTNPWDKVRKQSPGRG